MCVKVKVQGILAYVPGPFAAQMLAVFGRRVAGVGAVELVTCRGVLGGLAHALRVRVGVRHNQL